jgi:DNA invertase Pin-like site-specific DNA recombinase
VRSLRGTSILRTSKVDLVGDFANPRFPEKSLEELQHIRDLVFANRSREAQSVKLNVRDVHRRLGREIIEQIVAEYEAGAHTTELMAKYRISKSSVLKILRENNVIMRRQPMTSQQIEEAVALYEQGNSPKTTADHLKLTQQNVRLALLNANIDLRKPAGG